MKPFWTRSRAESRERRLRTIIESMIHVLQSPYAGNPVAIFAAQVIEAKARFSHWFGEVAKKTLTQQELLAILERHEADEPTCDDAARQFEIDGDFSALVAAVRPILVRLRCAVLHDTAAPHSPSQLDP